MKVLMIFAILIANSVWGQTLPTTTAKVKIERVGDMTHMEFSGLKIWEYDLSKDGKKLKIVVPMLDEGSKEALRSHQDLLIEKIETLNQPKNRTTILASLYDKGVENFDYFNSGSL